MVAIRRSWILVIIVAIVNPLYGLPSGEKLFAAPAGCSCTPWAGIYPTVVMPFCHDGRIDAASLERQIRFQVHGGVRGVLVLGTIGEGEYATLEERAQVIATAVRSDRAVRPGDRRYSYLQAGLCRAANQSGQGAWRRRSAGKVHRQTERQRGRGARVLLRSLRHEPACRSFTITTRPKRSCTFGLRTSPASSLYPELSASRNPRST